MLALLNRRGFLGALSLAAAAPALDHASASLHAASPTPTAAPIVESLDEEGGLIVACRAPVHDGGELRFSLSELPEFRARYLSGSVYFHLYQEGGDGVYSEQDFGVCLTPHEVDTLIERLVAVRDRACARRLLGGLQRAAV